MERRNVIAEANEIVHGERHVKYGSAVETFSRIASIFNAIRSPSDGGPIGATGVAKVLVAMKLVRDSVSPENPDHARDTIGYLGLLDEVRQAHEQETA